MSQELVRVIAKAKSDAMTFLNAKEGQVFVGESGTELLFRMISNAIIESKAGRQRYRLHPGTPSFAQRCAALGEDCRKALYFGAS